jgi:hypothetical protein
VYTEFLKRFPNSAHAAEAKKQLPGLGAGLDEGNEQVKSETPQERP